MSAARASFLGSIQGLGAALRLDVIASGAAGTHETAGVIILRRGMLITALIALETFVRDRTTEILTDLSRWPASYDQLPFKLREAALLSSLAHLQRYATMLKRQQDDYEVEIIQQLDLMAMNKGPVFGFSKFVAGDYTGNLSEHVLESLVSTFQVANCWNEYRLFAVDIGFGVPSVKEAFNGLVRKRHRSAHAAGFVPAAADIQEIPSTLACVGMCFDASMTFSVKYALTHWVNWTQGNAPWRAGTDIFFVDPAPQGYRLTKRGNARALRVLDAVDGARTYLRPSSSGRISILVERDAALKPCGWTLL